MAYSIKILYNDVEVKELPFANGLYTNNTPCDNEGYVYAVDSNNQKFKNNILLYNTEEGKYSDGTLCDSEGYIYAVDEDNVKYKLYEAIDLPQCDKSNLIIKIEIDDKKNNPNYFITDVDEHITYKKKWDCLELFIERNTTKNDRELSLTINHNTQPHLKRKITILQSGDICNISSSLSSITYNSINDLINITPHEYLTQFPQSKEELNFNFNVSGGSKKFFVKNIEQYIIGTKKRKSSYKQDDVYDLNDSGNKYIIRTRFEEEFIVDDYQHDDGYYYIINGYNLECDTNGFVKKIQNSIYTSNFKENPYYIENVLKYEMSFITINNNDVKSTIIEFSNSSYEYQQKYKQQQVLKYFYENGEFEHIKNKTVFYDINGDLVTFIVNYVTTTTGEQSTKNYVYELKNMYEEVEYVEKIQYDGGLNTFINGSKLTIENYGRLFLYGLNSIYRIILTHVNDLSKTFDLYLKYTDLQDITPLQQSTYNLKTKNSINPIHSEVIDVNYKQGNYRCYIEHFINKNVFIEYENKCEWITHKVVNNFIYFIYKDNIYKEDRSVNITIKIGKFVYKNITINQKGFDDYKIIVDYDYYELSYNKTDFQIKVDVYGGDKTFNILKNDCYYEFTPHLFYEGKFFNSYFLNVKPYINNEHKFIKSSINIIHSSDNNLSKEINFLQKLNINSIEYTVLCDNVLLLDNYTTYYELKYETYPFKDAKVSCEVKCNWLNVEIVDNKCKITLQKNYNYKRSTILKLTNEDFPSKQKFVKIIQKGTKK